MLFDVSAKHQTRQKFSCIFHIETAALLKTQNKNFFFDFTSGDDRKWTENFCFLLCIKKEYICWCLYIIQTSVYHPQKIIFLIISIVYSSVLITWNCHKGEKIFYQPNMSLIIANLHNLVLFKSITKGTKKRGITKIITTD